MGRRPLPHVVFMSHEGSVKQLKLCKEIERKLSMEIPAVCVIYVKHKALEAETHPALKYDMTSYTLDLKKM